MSFNDRALPGWGQAAQRPQASLTPLVDPERVIDIVLGLALLLVSAPVLLIIALVLWVQDDGPIVFGHRRLGRGGGVFACYKFRSMFGDADERLQALLATDPAASAEWTAHQKLRRDPRVTAVGRFLRKTSLDELPQLINVLRGEMSMVGPRPIVEAERARYGRRFSCYAGLRPGLTGLWQVSGRNRVRYRRRVAMDVVYAQRRSLGMDCRILLATAPAVLFARGAC